VTQAPNMRVTENSAVHVEWSEKSVTFPWPGQPGLNWYEFWHWHTIKLLKFVEVNESLGSQLRSAGLALHFLIIPQMVTIFGKNHLPVPLSKTWLIYCTVLQFVLSHVGRLNFSRIFSSTLEKDLIYFRGHAEQNNMRNKKSEFFWLDSTSR
jgi:hypothetical protein